MKSLKMRRFNLQDFEFKWRFHDYEIRTVREKYDNENHCFDLKSNVKESIPLELVKWDGSSCYTIAWFCRKEKGNGYELHSIGNRLFDVDSNEIAEIWIQLKAGQEMLDKYDWETYKQSNIN